MLNSKALLFVFQNGVVVERWQTEGRGQIIASSLDNPPIVPA
jgi:hypothetical protein